MSREASSAGLPVALVLRYLAWAAGHGVVAWAVWRVDGEIARGLGVVFGWLALDHLLVAAVFALRRPGLFGKRRRDGRLRPLGAFVFAPYLAWLWTWFHAKRLVLRGEPCWNRVTPGLYLGRRPLPRELPDDVAWVVDLSCEMAEPPGVVRGRRYTCVPMLNRWVPALAELEALVAELAPVDGAVYVHCGAGKGRSALVAAALLVARGHADGAADAERRVEAARPIVGLHACQRRLLERFAAKVAARQAGTGPGDVRRPPVPTPAAP